MKNQITQLIALWYNTPRFSHIMRQAMQDNKGKTFWQVVGIEYRAMRSVKEHLQALALIRG